MVNFPVPMETTSLRGLALAPLVCPRKGVGLITVPEHAVAAINAVVAMIFPSLEVLLQLKP